MYDFDCECCENRSTMTDDAKARQYLDQRLRDVWCRHEKALRVKFFTDEAEAPKTPKELADRLAAGKFTVRDEKDDDKDKWYGSIKNHIEWRDPKTPADKAGFAAFEVLLDKQNILAQDAIMVKTPADGLAALQAFEAWTQ